MKIAFVAQPIDRIIPPVRGASLSLWIYYMSAILKRRGHEITIIGNNGHRLSPKFIDHEGIKYILTPTLVNAQINRIGHLFTRVKAYAKSPRHSGSYLSTDWYHSGFGRQAAQYISEFPFDVVHIMNFSQLVPAIRQRSPYCKIALHMHCEWLTQFPRNTIESRLHHIDLIIGCSEYITKTVADAFPQFANKCVTVPNAADIVPEADIGVPSGKRVLFVGRLSPEKGLHDLVTAFHLVLEKVPEASLHLIGGVGSLPSEYLVDLSDVPFVKVLQRSYERSCPPDGRDPYLATLEELAGAELGRRIIFEGHVNHDEILTHYQTASVLVNPSLSESFGISLVEAMMMKVPVVATRIGGMSYTVVSGQTGFLVDPANPDALADAICRVLQDPELARNMGLQGQKRAHQLFSWKSTSDLLLQAYGRIVD